MATSHPAENCVDSDCPLHPTRPDLEATMSTEPDMGLWDYWSTYYDVNRQAWPEMSRPAAAWDAFKLSLRVKGWLPMKGRR